MLKSLLEMLYKNTVMKNIQMAMIVDGLMAKKHPPITETKYIVSYTDFLQAQKNVGAFEYYEIINCPIKGKDYNNIIWADLECTLVSLPHKEAYDKTLLLASPHHKALMKAYQYARSEPSRLPGSKSKVRRAGKGPAKQY